MGSGGGITDKNTVETDQESSLVQAAYQYCLWSGDFEWLNKEINGKSILSRLEAALFYLTEHKTVPETGLLTGAHTIDWGDVELGEADQNAIYFDEHSLVTIDIYDQAMFVLAARQLSELFERTGSAETAGYWAQTAETISQKARKKLWIPEHGYFRVCSHVTEYEHNFDEDEIFGMGGNAMAVLSGIADEEMAASIFDVANTRQREYGISTISGTVLPPYPQGTFPHPAVNEPYCYQNGGQWDWFGARLILAMYQHGHVELANEKLDEIAGKICGNQEINEWENPAGLPMGSSDFAGAAGVIARAIVEGRYGITLDNNGLKIEPNLPQGHYKILLNDSASGRQVGYSYEADSEAIEITLYGDYSGAVFLSVPLPENIGLNAELVMDHQVQKSDIVRRYGIPCLESTFESAGQTKLQIQIGQLETAE